MNLGHSFQRSMRMRSSLMPHRRQLASQSPPMEASRPPMSNPILPIVFMIRRRPRSRPKQVVSRRRSGDPGGVSCMLCRVHNMNLAPGHREEE